MKLKGRSLSTLLDISQNEFFYLLELAHKVKKEKRGGHNKETIMLNIETFKKFCLKAGTKKADEIHDYFIKMEEVFHEVLMEESEEPKTDKS